MEVSKIIFKQLAKAKGIEKSFENLDINGDNLISEQDVSAACNKELADEITNLLNTVDEEINLAVDAYEVNTQENNTEISTKDSISGTVAASVSVSQNNNKSNKDVHSTLIDESLIIDDYTKFKDILGEHHGIKELTDFGSRFSAQAKKDLILNMIRTYLEKGDEGLKEQFGMPFGQMTVIINSSFKTLNLEDNAYVQFSEEEYAYYQELKSQLPQDKAVFTNNALFEYIDKYWQPQNISSEDLQEELLSGKEVPIHCAMNYAEGMKYTGPTKKQGDYVTVRMVNGELIYSCGIDGGALNLSEKQISTIMSYKEGRGFSFASYELQGAQKYHTLALQVQTSLFGEMEPDKEYSFTNEQGTTSSGHTMSCCGRVGEFELALRQILKAQSWVKDTLGNI